MHLRRLTLAWILVVAVVAALAPAAALADGPSAGDQQYVDPLSGANGGSTTKAKPTPTPSTTSSAPTQATQASGSAVTASSSSTLSASSTASTAAATTSTTGTLPRTGFDAWTGAELGVLMLGGGLLLRRRLLRS